MSWNEDLPKKTPRYELGADLSTFSVHELEAYVAMLEDEKKRVMSLIETKKDVRDAAASVFKS